MIKSNSDKFLVEDKGYFIQITRKEDNRVERIRKRKASKNIKCGECNNENTSDHEKSIRKGDEYIRDEFYYSGDSYNHAWKRVNDVCLKCWRGELPSFRSTNMKRK